MSLHTPSSNSNTQAFQLVPSSGLQYIPSLEGVNKDGQIVFLYDPPQGADQNEDDLFLKFEEEPLSVSIKYGFGYLQVEFGDHISPDNRYKILRKLGWGMQSSVWLAKDTVNKQFVAIKALNGYLTNLVKLGAAFEFDVLQKVSSCGKGMRQTHCLSLLDYFNHPGKDEGDGEHICLVTDLLGPSLSSFKSAVGWLPTPLLKKILLDILVGLDHLHSSGVVHTDLRSDNIMMDLAVGPHALDIEAFIKDFPSERHPLELTEGKKYVHVAKSQPLPIPSPNSWMSHSFIIGDFGNAQFLDRKVSNDITPIDLRPPEIFLGIRWNEKVDIWTFGCTVFELISGQKLFDSTSSDLPPTEVMLQQMLLLTGDRFLSETCHSSPVARQVLDPDTGGLRINSSSQHTDLYHRCKDSGSLDSTVDLEGVVMLIKKCLRLSPRDCASARDLLRDPWLNSDI